MMKYLIVILTSLTLSGCFWQTANNVDLQKAVYFCEGLENVDHILINANGDEEVTCIDGSTSYLYKVKIPKENNQ